MDTSAESIAGTKTARRYRTQAERLRIVEETLSTGVSVATVARAHGLNADLIFHWKKLYHAGLLDPVPSAAATGDVHLLPVVVHNESAAHEEDKSAQKEASSSPAATVHIEFPGHAYVSVVGSADPVVIRAVLDSLRG
jgi:transposase